MAVFASVRGVSGSVHVFVGGVEHCFLIVHDPAMSLNPRPRKARLVDAEMQLRLKPAASGIGKRAAGVGTLDRARGVGAARCGGRASKNVCEAGRRRTVQDYHAAPAQYVREDPLVHLKREKQLLPPPQPRLKNCAQNE